MNAEDKKEEKGGVGEITKWHNVSETSHLQFKKSSMPWFHFMPHAIPIPYYYMHVINDCFVKWRTSVSEPFLCIYYRVSDTLQNNFCNDDDGGGNHHYHHQIAVSKIKEFECANIKANGPKSNKK